MLPARGPCTINSSAARPIAFFASLLAGQLSPALQRPAGNLWITCAHEKKTRRTPAQSISVETPHANASMYFMTNTTARKSTVALETRTIHGSAVTHIYPVPNQAARRMCREHAGAHRSCPVEMVPGRRAPRVVGESFYHTTPSGKTRVYHPNAYKWRTVYHPSTLRVEVGRDWLLRRCAH